MTEESEEDKKENAGQTPIETVERMGKYNPLRTRPVKVKFSEKRMWITYLRIGNNFPKECTLIKSTASQLKRKEGY